MIATIYDDFAKSASMVPKNAKMILRHSLRGDIPPQEFGMDILLTREGEVMSEHFGKNCQFTIKRIHSSTVERCLQTANAFAKGYERANNKKLQIIPTAVLVDSYIENLSQAQEFFKQHTAYWIISAFLRGERLPGMVCLHDGMQKLFAYIFQNECEDMEIFITHDTFLATIVCFCHQIQPEEGNFNWPYMLEGAFLYRHENKIFCTFRGVTKSIDFQF